MGLTPACIALICLMNRGKQWPIIVMTSVIGWACLGSIKQIAPNPILTNHTDVLKYGLDRHRYMICLSDIINALANNHLQQFWCSLHLPFQRYRVHNWINDWILTFDTTVMITYIEIHSKESPNWINADIQIDGMANRQKTLPMTINVKMESNSIYVNL